ncbi:MAG TPA: ABC transporter six-transmembrane domain-containing protein [Bacteroidales bacterium]|nr:ABC transporter six-transmembrane domain-containing protein [Bacteroidales bacterium]
MTLNDVIRTFKAPIAMAVSFVLLENISWIIEPTFFGNLLDALIDRFYDHQNKVDIITPLIIWIFVYLLNLVGGMLSRVAGGRIYPRIYAEIATRVITVSKNRNQPMTVMLARAELARDYITFLKERIPEVTWQFSATFGAIIAIFFYDWRIAAVCLLVIPPMVIINRLYQKKVVSLHKEIHDQREDLYTVLEDSDTRRIRDYYFGMIPPQRKIAFWNVLDYGIIKFILMIIFIVVLFICVDVDKFSTGNIYSVVAYLWTFISSTEYMPTLMESVTSVKELSSRLAEERHNPVIESNE